MYRALTGEILVCLRRMEFQLYLNKQKWRKEKNIGEWEMRAVVQGWVIQSSDEVEMEHMGCHN